MDYVFACGLILLLAGLLWGLQKIHTGGQIPAEELAAEIRANPGRFGLAKNWPQWVALNAALPVSEAWAAPKTRRRRRRLPGGGGK